MALKRVTPPNGTELPPMAELKVQVRISHDADDELLASMLMAAQARAEAVLGRALLTQTWDWFLKEWPAGKNHLELPKPPLQSVTHIKYTDSDGVQTTWDATNYIVDTDSEPGRVVLAHGVSWPSFTPYPSNPIVVRFVCGWQKPSDVPSDIVHWLKIAVADLYEQRQSFVVGQPVQRLRLEDDLLGPNRMWSF